MDKKKLQVVIVSFAFGVMATSVYFLISGIVHNHREQKKFLDSVYGEGYSDSLGGILG